MALRELQIKLFQSQHDFKAEFDDHHQSAKQAVEQTQRDGDRFGLLSIYTQHLKLIEEFASRPLPSDPAQQIHVLRAVIEGISPDGFGNILDVRGIDAAGDINMMRLLTSDEIVQFCGSEHPSPEVARNSVFNIAGQLARGSSVAFPAYDSTGNPTHWHFVGMTTD